MKYAFFALAIAVVILKMEARMPDPSLTPNKPVGICPDSVSQRIVYVVMEDGKIYRVDDDGSELFGEVPTE